MSSETPPIVMTFGLFDPTGASGLQADLLTFASMGCHGVTVQTGYAIRDSAGEDAITGLDPETIASQARMLLEDMPIAAFKIGAATRAEVVSVIAEIVADYAHVPLILAPDFVLDDDHLLAGEELRQSFADLLAPQTTLLLTDRANLLQLVQPDSDAEAPNTANALEHLVEEGCEYVLLSEAGIHQTVNTLYGESGQIRQDSWQRGPHRLLGTGDTLAAAIAALLANGLEVPEAVREAQEYLYQASRTAFRPGMGGFVPDRFFWARADDAQPNAASIADEASSASGTRH
ncbi:MAG: bifunctional hydroxymethylpyrimidine kinase/phosphomethylpyrimidine kinase [Janthinobacterium lividum]